MLGLCRLAPIEKSTASRMPSSLNPLELLQVIKKQEQYSTAEGSVQQRVVFEYFLASGGILKFLLIVAGYAAPPLG